MNTLRDLPNMNSLWGALVVEELVRLGVRRFCVCPGSRSTPLAVAVARQASLGGGVRKLFFFFAFVGEFVFLEGLYGGDVVGRSGTKHSGAFEFLGAAGDFGVSGGPG